jgi:hypothetical protein
MEVKTKRVLLWALAVALIIVSLESPQGLIFPMWIVVSLLREKLKKWSDALPLPAAFVVGGLCFGLLTETFAILDNLDLPPEERILLHPTPGVDLLMGFFYYGLFILTWFLLLRKIPFSKKEVFILSGIFGILTEQGGSIVYGIIANPPLGTIMAFLVMSVYGVFPLLAYMLTEHRFPERNKKKPWHYLLPAFAFFLFWAIYGNVFHKILLALFTQ